MGLHQTKNLFMANENMNKMERKPIIWENVFANDTLDKGLISEIYKEHTQLHSRKTKKNFFKGSESLNDVTQSYTVNRVV